MSVTHIVDLHRIGDNSFGKINLVQIGRLKCSPGHNVARHAHLNWFELTSIVDGEGVINGGDKHINVRKGDIFLSFPCEMHGVASSVSKPLVFDHFAFFSENAEYKDTLERIMTIYANPEKRLFKSYRIREMLDGCVNELVGDGEYQRDYLMSAFSLILLELMKIFEVKRGTAFIGEDILQSPEKLCSTVKHYIDTHLFSLGSLTELADLCGYNYSYLSYLFRKNTGITLSDYYKERRFESAKLMIGENRLKISEISSLLGYNSVYAFSKAFKDEIGMSPKNYYKSLFVAKD